MAKSERKPGDKVLAYKIAQHCQRKDCGRVASYYLEAEFVCESCFQKSKRRLENAGFPVIFPTYQEPQFGRLKSNMLKLTANSGKRVKNGGWDVKLARKQSAKGKKRKSRRKWSGKVSKL